MTLPKKLVYDIQPLQAESLFGCRENDNPLLCKCETCGTLGMTLSKAIPGFFVNIADKGLTAPVSYLESTLTRNISKH
jgi:hypothetical protein